MSDYALFAGLTLSLGMSLANTVGLLFLLLTSLGQVPLGECTPHCVSFPRMVGMWCSQFGAAMKSAAINSLQVSLGSHVGLFISGLC